MSRRTCSLAFASLLLCSATLLAQGTPPAGNPSQTGRRGNFEPCWQQAGIEKSVMEQRWATERDTRSQVEAVCSNTSLTPQQKHQQVQEIRQQARQKMEGLITPDQEKALRSCQQARGTNHGAGGGQGGGGAHEGAGGGCGEWSHGGAHPGSGPNATPGSNGGNSNPPQSNPSSPQN